jgi:hypothetical protein
MRQAGRKYLGYYEYGCFVREDDVSDSNISLIIVRVRGLEFTSGLY